MSARMRVARRENLTFPEPFYWTTSGLEQLRRADPDFRGHVFARALDALNSPRDKVRLAAEGDSWFDHPCIEEIIDWIKVRKYAVYRSDAPGRLLATMVQEKVYLRFLDDPAVRAMLLSGGGNDLISWKRTSNAMPSPIFKSGAGSTHPEDYLSESELDAALVSMRNCWTDLHAIFEASGRRYRSLRTATIGSSRKRRGRSVPGLAPKWTW
jgi:hypothetical protein